MYLKSLTLSGFKSFGKATVFEFPTSVTAIVGPNGSGKSNVAEALRWVLGEQSMKTLRGKKGEDLIFNGSDSAARLGRAEVKLIFDNSKKQFPFEFDDVIVSRRVTRDGANEYLLNGSVVRLKDIFELLSKVGLGSTQHHIISQGEVDRILWASPRERQEMIEEALGLKEYHMKLKETSRKLLETDSNVKQVEASRREIQPHLKYLLSQAEKMKAHEHISEDLASKVSEYAYREHASILKFEDEFSAKREPLEEERTEKMKIISTLQAAIQKEEKEFSEIKKTDVSLKELESLDETRRSLEREYGKIEGMLAGEGVSAGEGASVKSFMRKVREAVLLVDSLMQKDSFESLKSGLKDVKLILEDMVRTAAGEGGSAVSSELQQQKKAVSEKLRAIEERIRTLKSEREESRVVREDIISDLRERERDLREHERELEAIGARLRDIEYAESSYRTRREEWKHFVKDARVEIDENSEAVAFASDADRHTMLRSIERLRIKLEEAGGIDHSVVKEYEDTRTRDEFLARELEDLVKAKKALENLMHELEKKLHEEFTSGLKKINAEFQIFFKNIFGGGKANLTYVEPTEANEEEDEPARDGGIEIALDIPRKRLRSLDMLSGGERALTSVALLFAMSAVNPPPFLVLDETDAALDEANSQRYGDLLGELAKKTQLVVITHNRQTMGRAGVLYGVTMGGDGISKILSLKFEEATELARSGN